MFQILILEPLKGFKFQSQFIPSYVNVNLDAEEKSIHVWHLIMDKNKIHEWKFYADDIRGVRYIYVNNNKFNYLRILLIYSLHKRDERCLFLYVHENSDDFEVYFPSSQYRQRFFDLVILMTKGEGGMTNLGEGSTDQIDVNYLLIFL